MGSDVPGNILKQGTNVYISLHPDSREQADEIFSKLSVNGEIEMPMEDQFWGDYFGSFKDQFGICWMINFNAEYNASL